VENRNPPDPDNPPDPFAPFALLGPFDPIDPDELPELPPNKWTGMMAAGQQLLERLEARTFWGVFDLPAFGL